MSPLENRAWLQLWSMGVCYAVYFSLQAAAPPWLVTTWEHLWCFGFTAGTHGVVTLAGMAVLKWRERGQKLLADERDRAIDAHATRIAYFVLMAGAVLFGVVMPFHDGGWRIVNAALLAIVLAELLRNALIVWAYRGAPRLAH